MDLPGLVNQAGTLAYYYRQGEAAPYSDSHVTNFIASYGAVILLHSRLWFYTMRSDEIEIGGVDNPSLLGSARAADIVSSPC